MNSHVNNEVNSNEVNSKEVDTLPNKVQKVKSFIPKNERQNKSKKPFESKSVNQNTDKPKTKKPDALTIEANEQVQTLANSFIEFVNSCQYRHIEFDKDTMNCLKGIWLRLNKFNFKVKTQDDKHK